MKTEQPKLLNWFNDIEPVLNEKFIDVNDFAIYKKNLKKVPYGTSHYCVQHENNWKEKYYPELKQYQENPLPNYGLNQKGMDFHKSIEGSKWFDSMRRHYETAEDGRPLADELYPHQNFWGDIMVDIVGAGNRYVRTVNWVELWEDLHEDLDWSKDIIDYIIEKFGVETKIEFSW